MSRAGWKEKRPKRPTMKIKKRYLSLLALLILIPFLVVDIINYFSLPDMDDNSVEKVTLHIPRGSTLNAITDSLKKKELINDKRLFKLWLSSLGKDRSMKAGYFEIPKGLNYAQLAEYLSQAKPMQIPVTLLEGWSYHEMAEQLQKALEINSERFIELCNDSAFIKELGVEASNLEGYLLPDTYHFYWGMSEKQIIRILVKANARLFDGQATAQLDSLKFNRHQLLTMASIIEGEAILDDERTIIASVYYNRLRRRIKLQADPTIQYILPGSPRRLLYDDLKIDSPYNTYKYYGLPPGPINNPGKKSIRAALYPAQTSYIYFVARGDGGHTFSKTSAEHSRAKAKFNRIRRQVAREKRLKNQRD